MFLINKVEVGIDAAFYRYQKQKNKIKLFSKIINFTVSATK